MALTESIPMTQASAVENSEHFSKQFQLKNTLFAVSLLNRFAQQGVAPASRLCPKLEQKPSEVTPATGFMPPGMSTAHAMQVARTRGKKQPCQDLASPQQR